MNNADEIKKLANTLLRRNAIRTEPGYLLIDGEIPEEFGRLEKVAEKLFKTEDKNIFYLSMTATLLFGNIFRLADDNIGLGVSRHSDVLKHISINLLKQMNIDNNGAPVMYKNIVLEVTNRELNTITVFLSMVKIADYLSIDYSVLKELLAVDNYMDSAAVIEQFAVTDGNSANNLVIRVLNEMPSTQCVFDTIVFGIDGYGYFDSIKFNKRDIIGKSFLAESLSSVVIELTRYAGNKCIQKDSEMIIRELELFLRNMN